MTNATYADWLAAEYAAENSAADTRRKKVARSEEEQDWAGDDARDQGD